jgi:hypothetical protein
MHDEAYAWVRKHAPTGHLHVLDIGGRNINGSTRDLFPLASVYRTVDILPGAGVDIATMAGPGRPPHSAIDGGWTLHPGEHYANVHPAELAGQLAAAGFSDICTDQQHSPADTRAVAWKHSSRG